MRKGPFFSFKESGLQSAFAQETPFLLQIDPRSVDHRPIQAPCLPLYGKPARGILRHIRPRMSLSWPHGSSKLFVMFMGSEP